MNYEGLPCPVCGRHMHEDDDIVVCPDCGTPQHRECWMENGECVNSEKHAEGFVWSSGEKPVFTERKPDIPADASRICLNCGSENPADVSVCGRCGAPLAGSEIRLNTDDDGNSRCPYCGMPVEPGDRLCKNCGAPLVLMPRTSFASYAADSGFEEQEIIGGNTAGELSAYVRRNVKRYLPLFKKFENGRKISFNFAAFFFGPLWYFFRKMYKFGIIFIIVLAAASPVFATMSNKMIDVMEPYQQAMNDRTLSNEDAIKMMEELVTATRKDFAIGSGLMLACNLIFAFLADRLYYKKIRDDFEFLKTEAIEPNLQRAMIIRRGGTSLLSALCGFFTFRIASYIIVVIANYAAMNL